MQITFDLSLAFNDIERHVIRTLAEALDNPAFYRRRAEEPQPEVGENTGTSSTGITLSPGAAGVGEGAGAPASADQQATPSAPETSAPPAETTKRTRKPKETAAQSNTAAAEGVTPGGPDGAQQANSATAAPSTSDVSAPKLTIDDVRAKLQAFTGAKGIDAGLALLGEFKAGRISELKAEDYPAFLAKCLIEEKQVTA